MYILLDDIIVSSIGLAPSGKPEKPWKSLNHPAVARPPPPPHALRPSVEPPRACVHFPAVRSNGSSLVLTDGTARRYFVAGMVESGGASLSAFNASHFAMILDESARIGANALRWNAFLKGLDFAFEGQIITEATENARVQYPPARAISGLKPGCLQALRSGLDAAASRGMLIQVVLSTAHFLRYGYGGEGGELHELVNRDRVNHLRGLVGTSEGTTAYTKTVLEPLLQAVREHPALFGFLVVNEGCQYTRPSIPRRHPNPVHTVSHSALRSLPTKSFASLIATPTALHR